MKGTHILIVEDETDISELLQIQLESVDYDVTCIDDGNKAIEFIQNSGGKDSGSPIDLIILDRMLPGATGLEICKFIRFFKDTKNCPVLMLTALSKPEQIIEGLDAGADDYVTKPFDINILQARVRTLLRRNDAKEQAERKKDPNILSLGSLKIDTDQCQAFANGEKINLTLSEYKILFTFMQNPGKVMTRNQLVEYIQGGSVHVTDRTIDTHIFGLRKKLKEHSSLIETIRGIGYRVSPEHTAK
jgi:DNA-binding response OmpR family regulator